METEGAMDFDACERAERYRDRSSDSEACLCFELDVEAAGRRQGAPSSSKTLRPDGTLTAVAKVGSGARVRKIRPQPLSGTEFAVAEPGQTSGVQP